MFGLCEGFRKVARCSMNVRFQSVAIGEIRVSFEDKVGTVACLIKLVSRQINTSKVRLRRKISRLKFDSPRQFVVCRTPRVGLDIDLRELVMRFCERRVYL